MVRKIIFEVEKEIPIANVFQVVPHPLLHLLEIGGFPAPAVDLSPTRDARLDHVASM